MHYLSFVIGPKNHDEINAIFETFGPDTPLKLLPIEPVVPMKMDCNLAAIHDYVCSTTGSKKPFYLVMDSEMESWLGSDTYGELNYDAVIIYNENGDLVFHKPYLPYVWDWYVVGGRWNKYLQSKVEGVVSLIPKWSTEEIALRMELLEKSCTIWPPEDENKPGYNSLLLKDVDWEGMGDKQWEEFKLTWKMVNNLFPDAVSLYKFPDQTELFEKQLVEAKKALGTTWDSWRIRKMMGLTEEEAIERCRLEVFNSGYVIWDKEYRENEMWISVSRDSMIAARDHILSFDPESIITVVDIHN